MKNLKLWMLCGLAAMVLMTGCSKTTEPEPETGSFETAEMDKGSVSRLGTYIGVEVTRMSTEVTAEELDEKIRSILEANPERITVTDRAAAMGDIVNIDFVGLLDGVAFEGGTSDGYELTLGSKSFIDGFEEGIVGAGIGDELSLNLTFPESYHSEELAGKAVVFDVTVNGIETEKEAVLDNNFVQRMSDFNTVDEFKADTLADLETTKESRAEEQIKDDAIAAAIAGSEYDINEAGLEQMCDEETEYYKTMYPQTYGIEFTDYLTMIGQTEEQFREELKSTIRQSLEWELLVDAIAAKEGITVGTEELETLAAQYGVTVDDLNAQYGEDAVNAAAKKNMVYTLIVDNAVVR